jgi:hypothetical protein
LFIKNTAEAESGGGTRDDVFGLELITLLGFMLG